VDVARYAALFRSEAREHLADVEAALLALERAPDRAQLDALFRATHSLKGMAGAMGHATVERTAHALETLLDAVRTGRQALGRDVLALLVEGADALGQAVDDAVDPDARHAPSPDGVVEATVDRLLAAAGRAGEASAADDRTMARAPGVAAAASAAIPGLQLGSAFDVDVWGGGRDGRPAAAPAVAAGGAAAAPVPASAGTARLVAVRLAADGVLKGARALLVLRRLAALGTVRRTSPPEARWLDETFDGAFTIELQTTQPDVVLEDAARGAGDVAEVAVRAADATRRLGGLRTMRVDVSRLDALLDLMGELVVARERLLRAIEPLDSRAPAVDAAQGVARLVAALQEEVLQLRMVPVGQVMDRFPRLVREAARELGKDVAFVIEGREIELDRSLLDAIGDPLVHLLRNAVDHGIEDPESRRAAGKPPTGRLVVRARRDRAAVLIEVEDDGRGVDADAVRQRAVAAGLLAPEEPALDDDALLGVLARPGFSTAARVSRLSGRGVGIDAVLDRVRTLGGSLALRTAPGQGTTFTLRLPVTLAILRALVVGVADAAYVLPADHVVEVLEAGPEVAAGDTVVRVRDEALPLVRLRERFGATAAGADAPHLVVVEVGGRRVALHVDALLGHQDVVVKGFDAVRGSAPWFSGATILGDGAPALIVDMGSVA
jgi:two-component system chemotaxis sensor kinase CheA